MKDLTRSSIACALLMLAMPICRLAIAIAGIASRLESTAINVCPELKAEVHYRG